MLFADNIVLLVETMEDVNSKLEEWRAVLEIKWLRISRMKTGPISDLKVTIGGEVVTCTTRFKYLRSVIHNNE